MNKLEANIMKSFKDVRKDMDILKKKLNELGQEYQDIINLVVKKEMKKSKKKTSKKKGSKGFVVSKEGRKFHISECPFAKNIKPKTKKTFKSKTAARNAGYKPCVCVGL